MPAKPPGNHPKNTPRRSNRQDAAAAAAEAQVNPPEEEIEQQEQDNAPGPNPPNQGQAPAPQGQDAPHGNQEPPRQENAGVQANNQRPVRNEAEARVGPQQARNDPDPQPGVSGLNRPPAAGNGTQNPNSGQTGQNQPPSPSNNSMATNHGTAILGNTVNVANSIQPGMPNMENMIQVPPGVDRNLFMTGLNQYLALNYPGCADYNSIPLRPHQNVSARPNAPSTNGAGTAPQANSTVRFPNANLLPSAGETRPTRPFAGSTISTILPDQHEPDSRRGSFSSLDHSHRDINYRRENWGFTPQDRELDHAIREILEDPTLPSCVGGLRFDHSPTLTRVFAREVAEYAVRCCTRKRLAPWDFENCLSKMAGIRSELYKYGVPSDSGWRNFQDIMDVMKAHIEIASRVCDRETSRPASAVLGHLSAMSTESRSNIPSVTLKTLKEYDGSDIEEYLTYFEMLTHSLSLSDRVTLFVSKMGQKYAQTLAPVIHLSSWNEVKKLCSRELGGYAKSSTQATLLWMSLSQGSRTLQEYHAEVRKLVDKTELCDMQTTDQGKIVAYVRGLSDYNTRLKLMGFIEDKRSFRSRTRTLEEFMEEARKKADTIELATLASGGAPKVMMAQSSSETTLVAAALDDADRICKYHDNARHSLANCRQHKFATGKCVYCEAQVGVEAIMNGSHRSSCPKTKNACTKCGSRSHAAEVCGTRDWNNRDQPPRGRSDGFRRNPDNNSSDRNSDRSRRDRRRSRSRSPRRGSRNNNNNQGRRSGNDRDGHKKRSQPNNGSGGQKRHQDNNRRRKVFKADVALESESERDSLSGSESEDERA